MSGDFDIEISSVAVNAKSYPLTEVAVELMDKVLGNACTDKFDFEFASPEECKEKGVVWECKGWKKKENLTEDQKIRKFRVGFSRTPEEIEKNINHNYEVNVESEWTKHLSKEIKAQIDQLIQKELEKGK